MPVAVMHKVCKEIDTLTGGDSGFKKVVVSQWVGSLQTFRQPRTSMESTLTESLADCLAACGEEQLDNTVVHTVSVGGETALLYDTRKVAKVPVVANQSYLPIQLAIHNMSYLMVYDLQRRVTELGCIPVAFATDSVTFISPERGTGHLAVPSKEQGLSVVNDWLSYLTPLPPGLVLHMESKEKTQGTQDDDGLKPYICNTSTARSFSADYLTQMFDCEADMDKFVDVVAGPESSIARDSLTAGVRLVCERQDWDVHVVADELVDVTVDRLTALLATRSAVYIEGQGGGGKTYLVANFIRRTMAKTPGTRFMVTGLTHDGCSALVDAIVVQVPDFDTSLVTTLDAALRSSSGGFSKVNLLCDILVIDEISMLSETHISYLANIAERQRGMKIIWLGDLLQLLAVSAPMGSRSALFKTLAAHTRLELTVNRPAEAVGGNNKRKRNGHADGVTSFVNTGRKIGDKAFAALVERLKRAKAKLAAAPSKHRVRMEFSVRNLEIRVVAGLVGRGGSGSGLAGSLNIDASPLAQSRTQS